MHAVPSASGSVAQPPPGAGMSRVQALPSSQAPPSGQPSLPAMQKAVIGLGMSELWKAIAAGEPPRAPVPAPT